MKFSKFTYLGIGLIYFLIILFLVLMTAGIGLGDNSTVDTSKLTAAIKVANTKAGAAVAGIEIGQYPQSAINSFNKAIATAQAVAKDKTATQIEINKAVTNLQAAEKTFDAAKITTINKSTLTTAITTANTKVKNAVAGAEVGQYPQSVIDVFNVAIATAQAVADDKTTTQAEVNQAVTNLQAAEKVFDAAKITTMDKSTLTASITAASTKVKSAVAGTETGQYPQSVIDAFNTAIATAQEVINDKTATQSEITQAVSDLKAAEMVFDAAEITTSSIIPQSFVTNLNEADAGPDWINWTWVNPNDAEFSHVTVYMNGSFIADTSDRSVNYYNATGLSDGNTYIISIRTVDISGNISSTWVNDSATTLKLPSIYYLSAGNITDSSITFMWEASNDTTLVEILRDDISISNTTSSTSYVDSGLSSGTTYSYTLVPYNMDGLEGKAVSIKLDTLSSQKESDSSGGSKKSTSSGSSSSGGESSFEDFENIAWKYVANEYLQADSYVTYEFTGPGSDILSISFYSLKTLGEVTSTIEVLKDMSELVNSSPEGLVYEYINIWVGKAGFTNEDNIDDASVQFKVNSSWIRAMDVSSGEIKLQRYDGTAWEVLPTTLVNDTMDYMVFESQVQDFSSFAITAERVIYSPADNSVDTESSTEDVDVADTEQVQPKIKGIWIFIGAVFVVQAVSLGFDYWRRKKK